MSGLKEKADGEKISALENYKIRRERTVFVPNQLGLHSTGRLNCRPSPVSHASALPALAPGPERPPFRLPPPATLSKSPSWN